MKRRSLTQSVGGAPVPDQPATGSARPTEVAAGTAAAASSGGEPVGVASAGVPALLPVPVDNDKLRQRLRQMLGKLQK